MKFTNTFRLASSFRLMALLSGVAGLSLISPIRVQAQNSATRGPVTVELKAFKVSRDENGKEQLLDATHARPGDVLEYRATYANSSQKEVKNLQANLPIPTATELILDSVAPKSVLASADGRTFAAAPLMHTVKLPSGEVQSRPLPLGSYRVLRWPIGSLGAGATVTVRARVRLYGAASSSN